MRNALYILAGIALLVGAVAPVVHAGGTKDPWPTDPKDPWPPKEECTSSTAEGGCPPPFDLVSITSATESFDDNGDGCVCVKDVPGKGNTGEGLVAHDNKH